MAHDTISPTIADFIRAQHVFFVATAPLSRSGHINLSPKGLDTLAILDERTVAYLDLTGSGAETVAHLKENGRIVIMFCAFEGPARIVRLHGHAEAVEIGDPRFQPLADRFPPRPGARAVVRMDVRRVAVSCGTGVPLMDYRAERSELDQWSKDKGEEGLRQYRLRKNAASIDGLPAMTADGAPARPPEPRQ